MAKRKTSTVRLRGRKPIRIKKGALRSQLGAKKGRKIPAKKLNAAAKGRYGKKAQKRALFKKNVLRGRR
jgi:hypothetical protein